MGKLLKYKKYEKFSLSIFLVIVLIIFEIIFIINIIKNKNELYISYSGVVAKSNIGLFIVNDDEMNIIYKNRYLYFNGRKIKYSIEKITRNVIKKDNKKYNEVLINFQFSKKKYKDSDVISISIRNDKEPIINMFKIIWKGDNNEVN